MGSNSRVTSNECVIPPEFIEYQNGLHRTDKWWPSMISFPSCDRYLADTPRFKIPRVLEAKARGHACFDFDFYLKGNRDLQSVENNTEALWRHYVYFGQFESRPSRFTCPFDMTRLLEVFSA